MREKPVCFCMPAFLGVCHDGCRTRGVHLIVPEGYAGSYSSGTIFPPFQFSLFCAFFFWMFQFVLMTEKGKF